jgi:methionine transaminase
MLNITLESKLPKVGTTIFTTMSAMAAQYGAINLAQGFPNFKTDNLLSQLLFKYSQEGYNQYAPMTGVQVLREMISKKTQKIYQTSYDPENEITITSGATEALYVAISAVVKKGDEVIVFEPAYDSYVPAIILNGGIPIFISLNYPNYEIDWQEVEKKITKKTKLIIINNPHNPTGNVLSEEDILNLTELIKNRNIFLIGDEVYDHILFDGLLHHSLCTNPILKDRSFICGSFGKTFHITGWKVGYCLAPQSLSLEFRKIHQFLTFSTFTPAQYAIAEYLENEERYLSIPKFYEEKRDLFLDSLKKSRFTYVPSKGSFFQNLNYRNITNQNDVKFCEELTKKLGVASIPVSVFYHNLKDEKVLRFCFAKDNETLEKAGKLLSSL